MRAVNLIPSDQRRTVSAAGRSGGGAYAVLTVLGGFAILAFLYGQAHRQVSDRTSRAASLAARAQQAQAAAAQLAPYTSFVALREQRMQAVSQLVDSRFDWAHALHELGRVLPHGASVTTLEGLIGSTPGSTGTAPAASSTSTPAASSTAGSASAGQGAGATVTSATPPGTVPVFTVSGCATSQSEVALTLERLRLIDGVASVNLKSSNQSSAGAGSGSSGVCPPNDPAYSLTVEFAPLPASVSPSKPSATPVSNQGAAR
jgi:Tfp pilus assembly protein PilN